VTGNAARGTIREMRRITVRNLRTLAAAAIIAAAPAAVRAQAQPAAQKAQKPTGEAWQIVPQSQSSLVYARDGSLIGEIGSEWRTSISIRTLPKYVGEAFIAVEDKRFYQHNGVDMVGIAGALKDNLLGASRGASTITQQLVGNMHPDLIDRRDKSLSRKVHEQSAAREMERHYNKEQILEAFLNQISFGHGWYGIESAARHYFGKDAPQLTLAEAATLAAMPKGPAIYDPVKYPDRVKNRRDAILTLMTEQKFISPADAAIAKGEAIHTVANGGVSAPSPYFIDVVRVQAERAGVPIAAGGLKIFTTLDPALQRAAVQSLAEGTAEVERRPGYHNPTYASHAKGSTDYLEGAIVAIDPSSGDVKALVGGRNYQESPFNRAVSGMRQPGSSFKPFVYARALMDSLPANAIVADTAIDIRYDNQSYRPKNSDDKFLGMMTLREAITLSRNPVAVQLWMKYGADSIIALARRFGITTPISPYPASAIGASEVHPLEFIAAFTALDNLGTPMQPRFVYRVDDRAGKTLWTQGVQSLPPALDPQVTFILRDMMRDVVERGTATPVRRYLPASVPVAGKTGTTDENTDVWFVGVTPEIVAGVWLGFDKPRPIAEHGVAGGSLAAPVFAQMLALAGYTHPSSTWDMPAGIVTAELDRQTGKPADPSTPPERRYTEYFLAGTEPGALRVDARRLFMMGPIIP
jgi:penicillin-binding protein 2D